MSETYFITGAQGCIGSWIVKALIERGDQAVVFDRSDDSRRLSAIMNDGRSCEGAFYHRVTLPMATQCCRP